MTGDRDQDRFVKVIRGRGGNLPRISTVVLQFRATQKGPATGCACSACQRAQKASGPSRSAATKLLLLKGPDVGALYVCLRAVAVSWPVVSAG
jgi:hypothetical protein